ncbi:MAG: hypothetical protein GX628_04130 [Clostridiales bacterium]|nr:hypothetical protein [Clostridiales bacterium]
MTIVKTTRIISCLFIVAISLNLLIACGSDRPNVSAETDKDTIETTVAAETTQPLRENTPDSLPELNYEGAEVRIHYRGDDITRRFGAEGEETGDVVSDAVFARNRTVEERLNVKLNYIPGNSDHTRFMNDIKPVLLAGEDAYDLIDAVQWLVLPQSTLGLYYNLAEAPYIDYSQPWWQNDYIDTISICDDVKYAITGDISIYQLRMMSCMYFNKRIYEGSFGSPDDLFVLVLDGGWTYDHLSKYVSDIYQDLNGSGATDAGDILGISSTPISQTDHFTYTAGVQYTTRDKDGFPTLITDHSRNVKFVETLYDLYYNNPGSLIYASSGAMDKECIEHFTNCEMLFYPNRFYSTDFFRDMEDEYGVIPFPKLDETQEDYYALIHDSTTLYAVPITVGDISMPCAVMEAVAAENYRYVTPAYYEVALKVKYTRDNASIQIIDMIHNNARTDFVYANNYSLNSSGSLGTLTRSLMTAKSDDYMSYYAKLESSVNEGIDKLIESAKAEMNK